MRFSSISILAACVLSVFQDLTCSDGDRIVTFKEPMRNMVMENHVIRRDEVPNEGSCRVKCYLEPDCVSINVGPSSGGKLTCELNNATTGMNSTLRSKIDHTYLEISENPCSNSPCFNGGTCQAGFTSKGFRCQFINSSFANHHCEEAKSCSHLKKLNPEADSGTYFIDPDGKGNLAPFIVTCDMTDKNGVGVTVISHDSENKILVNGYNPPGSYLRNIHYTGVSLSQLASLTEVSSHCEQFIKYECFHSALLSLGAQKKIIGWWVSRNSSKMTYWGGAEPGSHKCACGMNNSCVKTDRKKLKCNCDKNDAKWREDSGFLSDKSTLPVAQLRFGDTGFLDDIKVDERGYHTLGKFKCYTELTSASVHTV